MGAWEGWGGWVGGWLSLSPTLPFAPFALRFALLPPLPPPLSLDALGSRLVRPPFTDANPREKTVASAAKGWAAVSHRHRCSTDDENDSLAVVVVAVAAVGPALKTQSPPPVTPRLRAKTSLAPMRRANDMNAIL